MASVLGGRASARQNPNLPAGQTKLPSATRTLISGGCRPMQPMRYANALFLPDRISGRSAQFARARKKYAGLAAILSRAAEARQPQRAKPDVTIVWSMLLAFGRKDSVGRDDTLHPVNCARGLREQMLIERVS
jgi:hypothetical protein